MTPESDRADESTGSGEQDPEWAISSQKGFGDPCGASAVNK